LLSIDMRACARSGMTSESYAGVATVFIARAEGRDGNDAEAASLYESMTRRCQARRAPGVK
jgi:hypothetical protein